MFRQGSRARPYLSLTSVPPTMFSHTGYHPLSPDFPFRSINKVAITTGSSPFARHYFGNLG